MSELLLALVCGILVSSMVFMGLMIRRGRRERALLRAALGASVLWCWQSDAQGRLVQVWAGRRRPLALDADPEPGQLFWHLPGMPALASPPPPEAIARAQATGQAFFDVPLALGPEPDSPVILLSALPWRNATGLAEGYAGTATLLPAAHPALEMAAPDPQAREALEARLAQLQQENEEQTRRFALASKEMESFSYSVSHDLRAPLRVVDGFANIVLEDYGARLDELGREHLRRIGSAANRMNAMIEALLSMSRRTGRELEIETVDLSRAARELSEELREGDYGRALEVRIEPDLRASGDPVLLRLVLQNLMGNAYKFTAHAALGIIEFGRHAVNGEDVFFVRDNGAGFDMRFADRLFGLFQRLHSQNEFPGTGVGLATVQRIVRRHGGRVWAESEPGKGACFYFTLAARPR